MSLQNLHQKLKAIQAEKAIAQAQPENSPTGNCPTQPEAKNIGPDDLASRARSLTNLDNKRHLIFKDVNNQCTLTKTRPIRKAESVAIDAARKVIRKAARLVDLMTDDDVEADLKVIRDARQADNMTYDTINRIWITSPDHKTRLSAAMFSRATEEGTPVARQVIVSASFEGLDQALERMKASPEAARILSAGQAIEIEGHVVENRDSAPPENVNE